MEQYRPNLGEHPEHDARRDAVHIACAPVLVADHHLRPGQHVGLNENGEATQYTNDMIGVGDPFLEDLAEKGTRVWLFLYPNTVTNLRHVWQHPAFKAKVPVSDPK